MTALELQQKKEIFVNRFMKVNSNETVDRVIFFFNRIEQGIDVEDIEFPFLRPKTYEEAMERIELSQRQIANGEGIPWKEAQKKYFTIIKKYAKH
ncbi:MAG: hypothetical protein IJ759_03365 [Bacteroidales bacterium]|nr:hypothetical protein [Bacteroidales bacterium]